jgi:nucleoside-diphosphate-sugar epimerase
LRPGAERHISNAMRTLITGASGFVGGHIADAVLRRGWPVHLIARPSSDLGRYENDANVKIFRGELTDAATVRQALQDVEAVIHCAAKVGDWGPIEEYRHANVEPLRALLEASKGHGLTRFVHVSSLGVYAARHHYGSDETMPLPERHFDSYARSKIEAEKLALQYYRDFGVPVVILRPGFVYGPRDRIVLPRTIQSLREGRVRYPGGGETLLNTIFIRNLVDAVLLALTADQAVGQTYNLTDGEPVTKRQFFEAIADAYGLPRPWRKPPLWLAWAVTWCIDRVARLRNQRQAPRFNLTALKFLAYNLDFSIDKARRELSYQPRVKFQDGMAETLAWYKESMPNV